MKEIEQIHTADGKKRRTSPVEAILTQDNSPEEEEDARITRKKLHKRRLPISVWVEVLFVALNVLSIVLASWYLAIGITSFGWLASLASIVDISGNITRLNYTEMTKLKYSMLQHNEFDLEVKAIILIVGAVIIFIGGVLSSYGAYYGQAYLLAAGFVLQCLVFPMEISVAEMTNFKVLKVCDVDPFRDRLMLFIRWYGIFHPNASDSNANLTENKEIWELGLNGFAKLSALQFDVGCCGVDGWKDYKILLDNSKIPVEAQGIFGKPGTPRNISGLPNSCCKPYWAQNIYCAEDLLNSTDTRLIESRLNQEGCVKKAERICERLKLYYVSGVRTCLIVRIVIAIISCILVFIQIRAIQLISRGGSSSEEEGAGGTDEDNTSDFGALSDFHEDHDPEFGFHDHQMHLMATLGANTDKIMDVLREKEREDEEHLRSIQKEELPQIKHIEEIVREEEAPIPEIPENIKPKKPTEERHLSGDSLTFVNPPAAPPQEIERSEGSSNPFVGTTYGQRSLSIREITIEEEAPRHKKGKQKKKKKGEKETPKGKKSKKVKSKTNTKSVTPPASPRPPPPKPPTPTVVSPPNEKIRKTKVRDKSPKVKKDHPPEVKDPTLPVEKPPTLPVEKPPKEKPPKVKKKATKSEDHPPPEVKESLPVEKAPTEKPAKVKKKPVKGKVQPPAVTLSLPIEIGKPPRPKKPKKERKPPAKASKKNKKHKKEIVEKVVEDTTTWSEFW